MKKAIMFVYLGVLMSAFPLQLSAQTSQKLFYSSKLWPSFFNSLGGLDFIFKNYARLIITPNGGIGIEDHFVTKNRNVSEHNVTIDSIYRGKSAYWKNHVSIYATLTYHDRGGIHKNQGNGVFPFPEGATAHLLGVGGPTTIVTDLYAQTHASAGTTPSSPSSPSSTSSTNPSTGSSAPGTTGSSQTPNQVPPVGSFPPPIPTQPPSPVNSGISTSTSPSNQMPPSSPSQPPSPSNSATTIAMQYLYQGREIGGGERTARLEFGIAPHATVQGKFRIWGTCSPNGAWMGARLTLLGQMRYNPKQIEGTVSGISFIENCPRAGGNFSHNTAGDIRIDFRPDQPLYAKIYGEEKSTEWIFHKINSDTPSSGSSSNTFFSVAGIWDTSFGMMRLQQKGRQVWGSYTHDSGKIQGILQGHTLIGQWSESPSYRPPKDAGDFYFRFSDDGRNFNGKWRYGFGGSKWEDQWSGVRRNIQHR
ncbi:hypothetical protein [Nitratifractor sp.]